MILMESFCALEKRKIIRKLFIEGERENDNKIKS
jgi:hypothetical protein